MSARQFLDQMNLRPSRDLLTSGANEPVADGGGHGHSLFARALLDGLTAESKPFTGSQLYEPHLHGVVRGTANQIPQYYPLQHRSDGGDFVFVPIRGSLD
jgi:hypothetical protein